MSQHSPQRDHDPALAALIEAAYAQRLDVETAARHLWRFHRVSGSFKTTRARTKKALVTVLAGGMLFMSSGGALAASGSALPGDMLYPVKRSVEKARIVLSVSREGDARLHLALAQRRMQEARAAAGKRPEVVPNLVREALDSIDVAERTGGVQVAKAAKVVRRETSQQLEVIVAVLDEQVVAGAVGPNRKLAPSEAVAALTADELLSPDGSDEETPGTATVASADGSPSASPSASGSPSASASPSGSPSATASPSASGSPSATASPSASGSPSATASPSASGSPSASSSPSASGSPSEPTPTSTPSRKYESFEPSEAPSGANPSVVAPAP